jgi:hypothetical protein
MGKGMIKKKNQKKIKMDEGVVFSSIFARKY